VPNFLCGKLPDLEVFDLEALNGLLKVRVLAYTGLYLPLLDVLFDPSRLGLNFVSLESVFRSG
jgi:hypothetical protein